MAFSEESMKNEHKKVEKAGKVGPAWKPVPVKGLRWYRAYATMNFAQRHLFTGYGLCNTMYVCNEQRSRQEYLIRPNYSTYPYKYIVKQFRSLQITDSVFFVYFFIKTYVVGTHLNCIDLSMQFKWVPTIYACKKKIRKKNQKKEHKKHCIIIIS